MANTNGIRASDDRSKEIASSAERNQMSSVVCNLRASATWEQIMGACDGDVRPPARWYRSCFCNNRSTKKCNCRMYCDEVYDILEERISPRMEEGGDIQQQQKNACIDEVWLASRIRYCISQNHHGIITWSAYLEMNTWTREATNLWKHHGKSIPKQCGKQHRLSLKVVKKPLKVRHYKVISTKEGSGDPRTPQQGYGRQRQKYSVMKGTRANMFTFTRLCT